MKSIHVYIENPRQLAFNARYEPNLSDSESTSRQGRPGPSIFAAFRDPTVGTHLGQPIHEQTREHPVSQTILQPQSSTCRYPSPPRQLVDPFNYLDSPVAKLIPTSPLSLSLCL